MSIVSRLINNPESYSIGMLQRGVQTGTIPPYIGIPLIQQKIQEKQEMQNAQNAGPRSTVAGQVMAQAQQETAPRMPQQMAMARPAPVARSMGIEGLKSNLPTKYASGGIVAFGEGGDVERYQQGGSSPAGRWWEGVKTRYDESEEASKLRNQLQLKYGPASAIPGLFMAQTDAERQFAKDMMSRLPSMTLPELRAAASQTTLPTAPATPAVAGRDTGPILGGVPGSFSDRGPEIPEGAMFTQRPPTAPTYGVPKIAAPQINLPSYTLEEFPALKNYDDLTKDLPKNMQEAAEKAVKATQEKLEEIDRPGFEKREARAEARSKQLAQDTEISRWMALLKGGFKTMGSRSPFASVAIGEGGEAAAEELIRGEAANRAAKDRLEDYRDNLEAQKTAAKKGNYQAAQAAGNRAADDVRSGVQLTMQAAHYGNSEATQRAQAINQSRLGQATLEQQGKLGIASLQQQHALGMAELGLKAQQLAQTAAYQDKVLAQGEKKIAALDRNSQVKIKQVAVNALSKFDAGPGMQLSMQLAKQYGENWRTGTDPRSLQAQMIYKQRRQGDLIEALGQFNLFDTEGGAARSAETLLGND